PAARLRPRRRARRGRRRRLHAARGWRVAARRVVRPDPVAAGDGGPRRSGHPVGTARRRVRVRVPGQPPGRGRLVGRGRRATERAARTAVAAAVHPWHRLHPCGLLLPRRAGWSFWPTAPPDSGPLEREDRPMKVQARGITHNVHVWGPEDGTPVLLIHGNCSSGAYWEPFVRALLAGGGSWRVVAPDLRGYGNTDPAPVDSTRGLRDLSDDVAALLPLVFTAGATPIVAGHSMGGGVAMHLTVDHPTAVAGLLLEAPVSPYGFGGTRDLAGTPTTDDFAGTGGG